jgi:hypothetical protein
MSSVYSGRPVISANGLNSVDLSPPALLKTATFLIPRSFVTVCTWPTALLHSYRQRLFYGVGKLFIEGPVTRNAALFQGACEVHIEGLCDGIRIIAGLLRQ